MISCGLFCFDTIYCLWCVAGKVATHAEGFKEEAFPLQTLKDSGFARANAQAFSP